MEAEEEQPPTLPAGLSEYRHQVGGRGLLFWRKQPILCGEDGCLYKPVQRQPKGPREIQFYCEVAATAAAASSLTAAVAAVAAADLLSGFRPFLAEFLGLYKARGSGQLYLGLEDALHGLHRPCVMDCKMGGLSTPPGAPVSKRLFQRAMYAHRRELGFIITGFRVHEAGKSEPRAYSILHGRSLDSEGVYCKGLRPFLMAAGSPARAGRVAVEVVSRLERLDEWFSRQCAYKFYASSLLIAFESQQQQQSQDEFLGVVVRAVDFAHVHRTCGGAAGSGTDENYRDGLCKLINYFRRGAAELSGV